MNEQPSIESVNELLEDALTAPADQQAKAVESLAAAIADESPAFIGYITDQLKSARVADKRFFRAAVRAAMKRRPKVTGNISFRQHIPSDSELANRWIAKHLNTVYGPGGFRRYENGGWPIFPDSRIKVELWDELDAAKPEGVRPTSHKVNQLLNLIQSEMVVPEEAWDAAEDVLPCKNGVVHTPTRILLPHTPEHHFTSLLPYDYDPGADCPNFLRGMETLAPGMANLLQELAGYTLTNQVPLDMVFMLCGAYDSGIGLFLTGLRAMLGDRSLAFWTADLQICRSSMSFLMGCNLVILQGSMSYPTRASRILNRIVMGNTIEVPRKYHDPMVFVLRARVFWVMEGPFKAKQVRTRLQRDIKAIEFPTVVRSDPDPDLKRLVKTEAPGILNWALEGLRRLREGEDPGFSQLKTIPASPTVK